MSLKVKSSGIAFNVPTINDFPTQYLEDGLVCIVTDENRGGTFVYREDNALVNNGGTIFDGWTRQYSGLMDIKWFGYGLTVDLLLYVSKSGSDTNNGFTSGTSFLTIQKAIDTLSMFIIPNTGDIKIIIGDGIYQESIDIPNNLINEDKYLKLVGSTQSLQQDPNTWAGVIIDGTLHDGTNTTGFNIGAYNNIEVEYILFRNWYNTSVSNVSQVQVACNIEQYANAYLYGCSGLGNGFNNVYVNPMGRGIITGGVYDGARYAINNTGGRLSFSASSSASRTIIKNGLEYGLFAKHQSSTVLDYTEFVNNGKVAGAVNYGSAVIAYKSGTSIDTRYCTFTDNNIAYNARDGHISTEIPSTDVLSGNTRNWLVRGRGASDILNYRAKCGIDLVINNVGGTTTGVTAARAYDSYFTLDKGYMLNNDQYFEIEILGRNTSGGTAQVLPSFYDANSSTRYQLGTFLVGDYAFYNIKLLVTITSNGTVATVIYTCIGASVGGTFVGQNIVNPIPFATSDLKFEVWGTTTSTNVLNVYKARMLIWG